MTPNSNNHCKVPYPSQGCNCVCDEGGVEPILRDCDNMVTVKIAL